MNYYKQGQTLLMLLIFSVVGIMVTSAAVVIVLVNSANAQKIEASTAAFQIAESGMENALLRFLRNPNYTGETMYLDTGTATITITGNNPYTLTSIGKAGNFIRKIQVVVNYNGLMTVTSWKEIN